MKKTRFTEEQMVSILREAAQVPVAEEAKKHGISDVLRSKCSVKVRQQPWPGFFMRLTGKFPTSRLPRIGQD